MVESTAARAKSSRFLIDALHPHWRGTLELFPESSRVVLLGHESWGNFKLDNNKLFIAWDKFQPDTFLRTDAGLFIQELILPAPIRNINVANIGGRTFQVKRIGVTVAPEIAVGIRASTSDIPTFEQIFVKREYESENLPDRAATIMDLGANVGYASVFFALRYPGSRIFAVEPDAENFSELKLNTLRFDDRIALLHGAAWVYDGSIHLRTENDEGRSLGAWGVQVCEDETASHSCVNCYTMARLLELSGFDAIDILKIDVEGAERELFAQAAQAWLAKTKLVIIETHDRFRPGSEASVRAALASDFDELPRCGENLFFRRKAARRLTGC